jgi:hypothetical protein
MSGDDWIALLLGLAVGTALIYPMLRAVSNKGWNRR